MATTGHKRGRRVERWFLGIGMSVVAIVLERRVIRSIKKRGETPPKRAPTMANAGEVVHEVVHDPENGGAVGGPR